MIKLVKRKIEVEVQDMSYLAYGVQVDYTIGTKSYRDVIPWHQVESIHMEIDQTC